MPELLLHPVYFPDVLVMAQVAQREVRWEYWDHFQKQTYRNRCYILSDQGKQLLNIPIRHVGGQLGRQHYHKVLVDHTYPWQRNHWKTLETAYRASPFFEFYEDDLRPLFEAGYEQLYDLNLATIATLCDCLGLEMPTARTDTYERSPEELEDGRWLANAKAERPVNYPTYHQVFDDRHDFQPGLSTLDLLFNLGPASLEYLEHLELPAAP